jgi:4-hydroxy-2-oxoheptanedioate aldolase
MTFYPRKNRILDNLKNNRISLGIELYTGNPSIIEICAYSGFDFYMLDMEHAAVDIDTMRHCIRAADAAGITTITRVAENNYALIARAIEEGSQGIIVPHVSSKEDARKAIDSMRYPPEGKKGSCPSIRGANYSTAGWDDYLEHHSRETMFIALIEDPAGVENMEEIFAELKPGVDAVMYGRGDLAQALTKPGEKVNWDHPYVLEGYEKMLALSEKTGIPAVAVPWPKADVENAKAAIEQGAKICLYSIDQLMFYDLCRDIVKQMRD